MKKSIFEVYALTVCFATIVCFVVALGIAIYDFVRIANPEFTLSSYEYRRYQNNDEYWMSYQHGYNKKGVPRPSEEELTKQRLKSYRLAIKVEKKDAFQSLTICSIILVINIIVFIVHWLVACHHAKET